MTEWLIGNWEYLMLGLYVAEKIVKLTPTDKDDIIFDIILGGINKLVVGGKKKKDG
jgi:hypothetical protein